MILTTIRSAGQSPVKEEIEVSENLFFNLGIENYIVFKYADFQKNVKPHLLSKSIHFVETINNNSLIVSSHLAETTTIKDLHIRSGVTQIDFTIPITTIKSILSIKTDSEFIYLKRVHTKKGGEKILIHFDNLTNPFIV